MAFSEALAIRIRKALDGRAGIHELKMFGGIGFLLNGNMLVGVWNNSLIVRLRADQEAEALREEHVKSFDITGRPMKGWILVGPAALELDADLVDWIGQAIEFVSTLPAK